MNVCPAVYGDNEGDCLHSSLTAVVSNHGRAFTLPVNMYLDSLMALNSKTGSYCTW